MSRHGDPEPRKVEWSTFRRLFRYILPYWELKAVVLLAVVTTVLSVLSPAIIGDIVDPVVMHIDIAITVRYAIAHERDVIIRRNVTPPLKLDTLARKTRLSGARSVLVANEDIVQCQPSASVRINRVKGPHHRVTSQGDARGKVAIVIDTPTSNAEAIDP